MSDGELLFAWLHLSDIHHSKEAGANSTDRELVLTVLLRDVETTMARGKVPRPSALVVTGDIAATGDEPEPGKTAGEYAAAMRWLDAFRKSLRLDRTAVFLVPGNHDVQRPQDADRNVQRLITAIRRGDERIEDVLDRPDDRAKVVQRQRNYLAFSREFGPRDAVRDDDGLWWTARLGSGIRLTGLNTALLARDDADAGVLRLGAHQLSALVHGVDGSEISLVLTHHPLSASWLHDETEVIAWFKNNVHVHLSGHVHTASSEDRRSGAGYGFVGVSAGAVHAGAPSAKAPRNHSYNFAALYQLGDGSVVLRVWHRRWSSTNATFVVDVDQVGEDHYAEHKLIRIPAAWNPTPTAPLQDVAALMYPNPLRLEGVAVRDIASAVQAENGVRVEMLVHGEQFIAVWAKPVYLQLDERKRLLLRIACLLAGDPTTKEIAVGFADTARLRNGVGADDFLTERFVFRGESVRRLAAEKRLPPDFWA